MTSPQPAFDASIHRDTLAITHTRYGHTRGVCLLQLTRPYSFLLEDQTIIWHHRQGSTRIEAPADTDAAELLGCISTAVMRNEERRSNRVAAGVAVSILALAASFALYIATSLFSGHPTRDTNAQAERSAMSAPAVAVTNPPRLEAPPVQLTPGPAAPIQDGWTLPESIRAGLPAKLQMAAERKYFTVDFSSGHPRTLYVFADPECPNCQRLEPALEAAAKGFNVVVFPVAVIGREKSIASITPVLCLPPEQRKAAWANLFDVGHGVMDMGKPAAESAPANPACDVAGKALGVNEVAYQTYRVPGTPWVIADDGRHVPQDVLQNSLKLQAFMNEAEVNHAGQ